MSPASLLMRYTYLLLLILEYLLLSSMGTHVNDLLLKTYLQGCSQVGKAVCQPATAVLYGLVIIMSFAMSHSVVEVEDTDWIEPVLVWVAI